jgi:hypothetical protein
VLLFLLLPIIFIISHVYTMLSTTYPLGPFKLVTVNNAPERAKLLIGRVVETVKDKYIIIHAGNVDSTFISRDQIKFTSTTVSLLSIPRSAHKANILLSRPHRRCSGRERAEARHALYSFNVDTRRIAASSENGPRVNPWDQNICNSAGLASE